MKPIIYISGKVTGLPIEEVVEKFRKAEAILLHKGFESINPITVVNNLEATWEGAMKLCVKALVDCEAVFYLPGSENSKGAQIEIALAKELGIPVFGSLHQIMKHFN